MLCNGNYLESKALKKICLTFKYYGLLYAISFQKEHKTKGRMAAPNQMNFRKISKEGGVIFNTKNKYCRFWEL